MNKNELISKIKELDALTLEEKSQLIDLINRKRYGLVWEDKPEDVEELLNEVLPVLSEVKERAIIYQPEKDEAQAPNHILIEGDNLHALTSLCFTHENKIDVIYIDPPYNTGNKDFRYYDSRFDAVRDIDKENPFRHSMWLSFISKRLKIAKQLLKDTGVIFISIDDNEVAQLKLLCQEIFGEENFISDIAVINNFKGRSDDKYIATAHEHLLIFKKKNFETLGVSVPEEYVDEYTLEDTKGKYRLQGLRKRGSGSRREDRPNMYYPIYYDKEANKISLTRNLNTDIEILPKLSNGTDGRWRWGKETVQDRTNELVVTLVKTRNEYDVSQKDYLHRDNGDLKRIKPKSFWMGSEFSSDAGTKALKDIIPDTNFNNPKALDLIKYCLQQSAKTKSIILDFFAGSGTTLQATISLNAEDNGERQCIIVTNSENNIAEEICYERNKRVINGYTKPNGETVSGLNKNNLRYYKAAFVKREKTLKNKRELTELATELLSIKENCYTEIKGGKQIRIFQEKGISVVIIYDDIHIPAAIELIKKMPHEQTIKVYVFAEGQDPYTEDFYEVGERVQLCALPDAIYKAFQNILPKKRKIRNEVTAEV